jgi:hypothetical protein
VCENRLRPSDEEEDFRRPGNKKGQDLAILPFKILSNNEQTDDYTLLGPARAVNSGLATWACSGVVGRLHL